MSLFARLKGVHTTMASVIAASLGADIKKVLVGRKVNVTDFKPPCIWILPEPSPINDNGMGLSEIWDPTYWLIAIVKSTKDSLEATEAAEQLAIRASGALLADRKLGGLAEDLTRIGWDPADSRVMDTDESLYGAAVRVKVKLVNKEVM